MDIKKIKELALANGFSLKEQASGNMDLHSYVYEFAQAVYAEAQKSAVHEGFVLVEVTDLREIISTASDAMMDEQTSSVYNETGEPSTWFDHYTVAEKRVLAMIEAQEQEG